MIGNAGDTAYGSATAALIGFARSLAKEVSRDQMRVNVLAPGLIETGHDQRGRRPRARPHHQQPQLRRMGTADEASTAAVFLSEDATYCTSTVLIADGGWSL